MMKVDEESPPLLDNEITGSFVGNGSHPATTCTPNGGTQTCNGGIKPLNTTTSGSSTSSSSSSSNNNNGTAPLSPNTTGGTGTTKTLLNNARGSIVTTKGAFRPRLVDKDGDCLVQPIHLPHHYRNLYRNWFHLIIENSWRSILFIFAAGFLLSWFFFGAVYYFIVVMSGEIQNREHHKQCIANVHSFTSAFLFSIESQHTIGYGVRYMTEMCPPAFIVLCIQLVIGVLLQTMLAGIIVAKVLRPKKRKQEMRFSRIAVIGPIDDHDHQPALMIRLADVQHRLYLAESHVRLYMACTRFNSRGEKELCGIKDLNVGYDSGWDRVLLLWPVIVRHVIDEESPLYGMTPEIMRAADFELIMTVEGIVEATGMTFQARTSFLPNEIQWGHRFTPMVVLNPQTGKFEVDYSHFELTERCDDFSPVIVSETTDDEAEKELPDPEPTSPPHQRHLSTTLHYDHNSILMHNASGFI
uniref:Inward rectifier potassium channel irk-1 n=1 Tax=Panagrellus redivivus TaxID=6233 RepID=A0A7E4VYQ5_PANRE